MSKRPRPITPTCPISMGGVYHYMRVVNETDYRSTLFDTESLCASVLADGKNPITRGMMRMGLMEGAAIVGLNGLWIAGCTSADFVRRLEELHDRTVTLMLCYRGTSTSPAAYAQLLTQLNNETSTEYHVRIDKQPLLDAINTNLLTLKDVDAHNHPGFKPIELGPLIAEMTPAAKRLRGGEVVLANDVNGHIHDVSIATVEELKEKGLPHALDSDTTEAFEEAVCGVLGWPEVTYYDSVSCDLLAPKEFEPLHFDCLHTLLCAYSGAITHTVMLDAVRMTPTLAETVLALNAWRASNAGRLRHVLKLAERNPLYDRVGGRALEQLLDSALSCKSVVVQRHEWKSAMKRRGRPEPNEMHSALQDCFETLEQTLGFGQRARHAARHLGANYNAKLNALIERLRHNGIDTFEAKLYAETHDDDCSQSLQLPTLPDTGVPFIGGCVTSVPTLIEAKMSRLKTLVGQYNAQYASAYADLSAEATKLCQQYEAEAKQFDGFYEDTKRALYAWASELDI